MTSTLNERYNEAERLKDSGNVQEAIVILAQLAEEHPEHVLTHLALAKLYTQTGQHEKAVEHGKKACELEPNEWFNFTALSMTSQRAWQGTGNQEYITLAEDAKAKSHMLQDS
jgi:Flp pilus assembly protein TadD